MRTSKHFDTNLFECLSCRFAILEEKMHVAFAVDDPTAAALDANAGRTESFAHPSHLAGFVFQTYRNIEHNLRNGLPPRSLSRRPQTLSNLQCNSLGGPRGASRRVLLRSARADPNNGWCERDLRNPLLSGVVLSHLADSVVFVGFDDKTFLRRNPKERQHVARRSRRNRPLFRIDRRLDRKRSRTQWGELDAGTSIPPSNDQLWPRVYWFFANDSGESFFHAILAVYVDISISYGFSLYKPRKRNGLADMFDAGTSRRR